MSELSVYKGLPSNFNEAQTLAKVFAESGMFEGAKGLAQAMVKVQAGAELGITPYAAMSGIHIISGKPVLGAGLIAAKIKGSGKYDYDVITSTDTECSIKVVEIRGGNRVVVGTEKFTIEMARKAGVKNLEKFPKNMLFARCISNAAKFYCPDIFNGSVYVPEEFEQETIDTTAKVVDSQPAPAANASKAEEAVVLASDAQLNELRALVQNKHITDAERNATLQKCSQGPAAATVSTWITKTKEIIAQRENTAPAQAAPQTTEQTQPANGAQTTDAHANGGTLPPVKAPGKLIATLKSLAENPLITEIERMSTLAKLEGEISKETCQIWITNLSKLIDERTIAQKAAPAQAAPQSDVTNFEKSAPAPTAKELQETAQAAMAAGADEDVPDWMK